MDQEYLLTESDRTKMSESSQIQIVSPKINSSTNQEPRRKSSNQSGRWRRPNKKSSNRETEALIDSEKTEHDLNEANTETNTEQITNTENTEQDHQTANENMENGDPNESEYTEHTERDGERSEQVTKSYSTVTAPSRAGSWLKPKVDYHPSLKQFNTLCSSQTVNTVTMTSSWCQNDVIKWQILILFLRKLLAVKLEHIHG